MRTISVIFRKENIRGALPPVRGRNAVVLDILRASTTMVVALNNGAKQIVLAATPEEAHTHAGGLAAGSFLLGGERGGLIIKGFDLGNSPRDYTRERVQNKTIVFTTTNGTRALRDCASEGAATLWIGCLLNVRAVRDALLPLRHDIVLVCAGTEGVQGADDAYAAGALVDALRKSSAFHLDDSAVIAMNHFRAAPKAIQVLRASLGGRNLIRAGLARDLADCDGARGSVNLAPKYQPRKNRVTATAASDA